MAKHLPFSLGLLLTIIAAVHGAPFNASLLGKTYTGESPCIIRYSSDRYKNQMSISATANKITYAPPACRSCLFDRAQVCYSKIVLYLKRRPAHPIIARYEKTSHLKKNLPPGATCESYQPVYYAAPWGPTRANWTAAVREIAEAALSISRFECILDPKPWAHLKETEGFVHYLVALMWDYYYSPVIRERPQMLNRGSWAIPWYA